MDYMGVVLAEKFQKENADIKNGGERFIASKKATNGKDRTNGQEEYTGLCQKVSLLIFYDKKDSNNQKYYLGK